MIEFFTFASAWIDSAGRVYDSNAAARLSAHDGPIYLASCGDGFRLAFRTAEEWNRVCHVLRAVDRTEKRHGGEFVLVTAGAPPERYVVHLVATAQWREIVHARSASAGAILAGECGDKELFLLCWRPVMGQRRVDYDALFREFGISRSEADVLELIGRGATIGVVARARGVSPLTVRNQLRSIGEKFGIARQTEIASFYAELSIFWGLGDPRIHAARRRKLDVCAPC